jgi:hypothetical protein
MHRVYTRECVLKFIQMQGFVKPKQVPHIR